MSSEDQFGRIARRSFLAAAAGGVVAAGLPTGSRAEVAAPELAAAPVDPLPTNVTRTWIGPPYWANRLQDWRLNQGRIECLTGTTATRGRTVAVLTRELVAGNLSAQLTVRTGTLARGSTGGFSGFLVGAGGGALDHRAAALVQGASGTGGGLLCTYDSDGRAKFRDHSGESSQFAYPVLPSTSESGPRPARTLSEDVELGLDVAPLGGDSFRLTLTAVNFASGAVLATATLNNVAGSRLRGGIALVSSCRDATGGARYWFRDFATSGPKVVEQPGRAVGPILGTLWSLNGSVLKLTAQFLPIGAGEPQQAQLQYRLPGGTWLDGPTVTIGDGWTALFRLTGWDGTRDWEYRVAYAVGTPAQQLYGGTIARDPTAKSQIVVGVLNCFIHSYRPLDVGSSGAALLPGSQPLGLYTDRNLYFPNQTLAANLVRQQPDLLVAMGDQYYDHRPSKEDTSANRTLDMVYRWSLWLWSFRDLTRDRPTVVLVDDHDVFHPNLWGHSGAPAPNGDYHLGGYAKPAAFVNATQRVQCGHNPDPFDPSPVLQGITVYYGRFRFGGVSFAVIEDRKFKTGDSDQRDANGVPYPPDSLVLLGARQEAFLEAWASMDAGMPKVCLSQTLWACLQTDVNGNRRSDSDANAYPASRRRALGLVKQAGALMLSGDQHLASLVRHGLNTFTDGPVQFVAPAGGTAFQRWFQPRTQLPNGTGTPYTGDFTDAYGNRLRVLAVANPAVSFATFRQSYPSGLTNIGDRNLKSEGYGLVRIDKAAREFVIECWPWNVDPTGPTATQFPGWPYRLPFAAV